MGSLRLRCLILAGLASLALAPAADARSSFHPRIRGAMGIVPAHGHADLASGVSIPVVFHGGSVMRRVTVHTVFWAPAGYRFSGSPTPGVLGYEQMTQRFFSDVAQASGRQDNVFSVLPQYADRQGAGRYAVTYSPTADSITDTRRYPARSQQCPSPAGIAACVTDSQIQRELDRVIQARDPSGHGLHDLWFVFLPPDVDTCLGPGICGTTAYAGYHSLTNRGHGPTVYAVVPSPLIEFTPGPGSDPQGNPEAETAIDVDAHETVEAITNPEGNGWMDPNGFEVGDKCENPEDGTPIGYAPNGSPYDNVINGHKYLIQMMWSNPRRGCVQRTSATASGLPLPEVNLNQFHPTVSGNTGISRAGVSVTVGLVRSSGLVAEAQGKTRADGHWGPLTLLSSFGSPRSPSDDRDVVIVRYGHGGPRPDLIATGDGGNPFSESGWTGWFDLDHGYRVGSHEVKLAPCGQTGGLTLRIAGRATAPAIEHCGTESDVATLHTGALTPATPITLSSQDNRAVTINAPLGALVTLTVPVGEPGAVSQIGNGQILFRPSGFPTCTADLRIQVVHCSGLRPGARYVLGSKRVLAKPSGVAAFSGFHRPLRGQVLALRNGSGRVLTRLHVAELRAQIKGRQTVLDGGSCEPGAYYGLPLGSAPISNGIGLGPAGGGTTCPDSGDATGLQTNHIAQVDDLSGGVTETAVPYVERTSPLNGETLYGRFFAQATSGLPGPAHSVYASGTPIGLTIERAGSNRKVFRARNVDTRRGVAVHRLRRGAYVAIWVLKDANGDTRTVRTQFIEAR